MIKITIYGLSFSTDDEKADLSINFEKVYDKKIGIKQTASAVTNNRARRGNSPQHLSSRPI